MTDLMKAKLDPEDQERAPGGDAEDNAKNAPIPDKKAESDPKSLFFDPWAIVEQLGYKERPTQVTYGTLRAIIWKVPIIQAVIQTRINQIASFAQAQPDKYGMGFRIKMRDSEKNPGKAEKDWIKQANTLILRTGVTDNPRGRDSFESFLRKLAWDSLVYDQLTFEVVPNKKGQPAEWYAVDSSTIRLADSMSTYRNEDDNESTRYVQIYDGMIITEYSQEELCFAIRNPRTDIRLYGYGTSELEMLVTAITSLLYSFDYNTKFFTQGQAQRGLINFKGAVPENQMKAFRRHWYQMLSGVENAWRTPILNADDVQWVNMQTQSPESGFFNAWMDFLIKVCCSMYMIDPAEVNFQYGNTGQSSSLNQSSNKEKIIESKDRGLRPLLRFIQRLINQYIIWPINEDFELEFVGLDAQTRDDYAKLAQQQVKTYRTVDEIRAEDDLPPLPDGRGDVILDPTYLQYFQVMQANAQQEAMGDEGEGGEGGPPGEGGEGEDEDEFDFSAFLGGDGGGKEKGGEGKPGEPAKPAKPAEPAEETEKSIRNWYGSSLTSIEV